VEEPTVADVMTRHIFALAPETSLQAAARMLKQQGISGAPVVATNKRPIGVLTLSDLVDMDRAMRRRQGYSLFYRIDDTDTWTTETLPDVMPVAGRVEDAMMPTVVAIDENTSILDAAGRLIELGIHRLMVTRDEALVGVVAAIDLLRGFVESARAGWVYPAQAVEESENYPE
jgi:CBS domain-containing protein